MQILTVTILAQDTIPASVADSSDMISADSMVTSFIDDESQMALSFSYLKVILAIAIVIFSFILMMYLRQPLQKLSDSKKGISRFLKQFISIFMIFLWFLLAYLVTTEVLDLSPILTVVLVVLMGLALISGLQESMKDLIAGLLIPFETYIEEGYKINSGEIQGEIVRIGMRKIELKTYGGKQAIVPSHIFLKKSLHGIYTEKENCPVQVDFFLQSNVNYEQCQKIAYKSTIVSPYLYLNKPINVFFENILSNGQNFTKMSIEAYLQKIEFYKKFYSELTITVNKELNNIIPVRNV
jgi:small-conductance mechanosensitive channel